jgi:hypothetical protein
MIVAFFGFQKAPDTRHVHQPSSAAHGSWLGWYESEVAPLLSRGIRDFHLHNPFGLYDIRDREMHIDQFEMARCQGYSWLANRHEFRQAIRMIHEQDGKVSAYVGSPLAIQMLPSINVLKNYMHCSPERFDPGHIFWWLNTVAPLCSHMPGLCERPLSCFIWKRFVLANIQVLLDARVDTIGFDASFDFHEGDCMYQLVEDLLDSGIEMMIEPWPRAGRSYPSVSWIIRELKYRQILDELEHEPDSDKAPIKSVGGPIYRIVPNHRGERGREEINSINVLAGTRYKFTNEIVESVQDDGHIPMVRWHQLQNGDVITS